MTRVVWCVARRPSRGSWVISLYRAKLTYGLEGCKRCVARVSAQFPLTEKNQIKFRWNFSVRYLILGRRDYDRSGQLAKWNFALQPSRHEKSAFEHVRKVFANF